jgi:hypothetical protein
MEIEPFERATEQLCCDYAWRDARAVRADTRELLNRITNLRSGRCTLRERRDLLVSSGWLILLLACLDYDLGHARQADHARAMARSIGTETGHGEMVAWSFELEAWFAITQGLLGSVPSYAEAGTTAAPHSSVAVQLTAQAAKARARMGDKQGVLRTLDEGFRLLARHDRPMRPDNHFVIDPGKWDFYAMDCLRLVGDDRRAAEHAHSVLAHSPERNPMRATEARLTFAVVAVRSGDLDAAAAWTADALRQSRRSVVQLSTVVRELLREARRRYPSDAARITEPALTNP